MKKHLAALALLTAAGSSWSAICAGGNQSFGTLESGGDYTYGAFCTAIGQNPDDPSTWSFTHTLTFSLTDTASIFGEIDLHFTRAGWANPQNPGAAWLVNTIDSVTLWHEGVGTLIGGEGAGHYEYARFRAFDIEAGDYTLVLNGRLFNTGARTGFYTGDLNVSYRPAPPVPEPATMALLTLGAPLAVWGARRRVRRDGSV